MEKNHNTISVRFEEGAAYLDKVTGDWYGKSDDWLYGCFEDYMHLLWEEEEEVVNARKITEQEPHRVFVACAYGVSAKVDPGFWGNYGWVNDELYIEWDHVKVKEDFGNG